MSLKILLISYFICFTIPVFSQDIKSLTENYEIAVSESFNEKSISKFSFTHPSNWMITKNGKSGKDLKCFLGINNKINAFFPYETALLNENFGNFIMTFDYMQNNKSFTVRDICVLFGYQDSTHYYYAQAAADNNKYCHNIFKVNNDRPVQIGNNFNKGVVWNYQKWHNITIIRNIENPKVELYIDGELILESSEPNGKEGKIGFGTYGSSFKIDNLKIWIPKNPN
ncbi:MAG: hypothetical protein JW717_08890 [Marinilabiliaceae bacterium]|nr:hypothetical protein [Marinilabiliaceae bacterium]